MHFVGSLRCGHQSGSVGASSHYVWLSATIHRSILLTAQELCCRQKWLFGKVQHATGTCAAKVRLGELLRDPSDTGGLRPDRVCLFKPCRYTPYAEIELCTKVFQNRRRKYPLLVATFDLQRVCTNRCSHHVHTNTQSKLHL